MMPWALLKRGYCGVSLYVPKAFATQFSMSYKMDGTLTENLTVIATAMFDKQLKYRELTQ